MEKGYYGHHSRLLCSISPGSDVASYDSHLFQAHKRLNNMVGGQGQQNWAQYKLQAIPVLYKLNKCSLVQL